MTDSIMQSRKALERVLAVAVALLLWQAAAMLLSQDFLLASPVAVIRRLIIMLGSGATYGRMWYTFYHIAGGFLLGLLAGVLLAIPAARFRVFETVLWPYMITVKSVPVVSFIILSYLFLSSSALPVFISFLIVLPVIYNNILNGIKNTDPKMAEMAQVFSLSWRRRILYITLPQIKPFLISGCQTAIGLAFKSGVAAEVIAIVKNTIGEQLYTSKLYFESDKLLAWTLIIVLMSVLFERLFVGLINKFFAGLERL